MKVKVKILIILCHVAITSLAQNLPDSLGVYTSTEKMPMFPGGIVQLQKFLATHINYPAEAVKVGASGKAFLKFVVDTTGSIKNISLLKSSGNLSLDQEALRVVSTMPKWNAALESGKKVNAYFNLPVSFKIQGGPYEQPPAESEKILTAEEKAVKELHEKAMHFYDLGVAQAQQERWEYALAKFDQCLKYEPKNEDALYNKTIAYIKMKKTKDACETWAQYKSFGYSYSEKVETYLKPYCN